MQLSSFSVLTKSCHTIRLRTIVICAVPAFDIGHTHSFRDISVERPPYKNFGWVISGTYKTQELPCGIRATANPWPVKMAINITSNGWPQGGLIPWGPQGTRAMWVPLAPDTSLFNLFHAPSAPPMTVANHWPLAEIVLPSKVSG